jgi:steroid 5-alpha reductase family enzyme
MESILTTPTIALATAVGLMSAVWIVSVFKRDVSIIDVFWGPGFVVLGWVYFALGEASTPRRTLVAVLVTLWGVRLAAHIFWRARGHGEDYRYREMRALRGSSFWWVSLFTVFWLQALVLWAVSLTLYQAETSATPAALTWMDAVGLTLFVTGFFFETVGDWQLARFKSAPANRGQLLATGLWRYTRHPNYFGDALVWWGFFFFALATPGSLWTIYSPALMTFLLMRVSGVALLEKALVKTKPGYEEYVAHTNAFFPWFPRG